MRFARARDLQLWLALAALAVLGGLLVVSTRPSEVRATAPDEHQLVVADLRGQALLVLDGVTGDAVKRIPLPGGPHELLLLPDGRVLASLEQTGELVLTELDTATVEVIEVGGTPHGLALDGDVLLLTDRATNELRRFNLGTWDELDALQTGEWPHAVQVLPDRRPVVVAAADSTLRIGPKVIDVSELPETVAIDSTGTRIATAGAVGGVLHAFDSDGGLLFEATLGGRPVRVLFSPDDRTIAVALSAAHEVALVDLQGGVSRVAVSGVPDGLGFTPDGALLYASDLFGGTLSVIDPVAGAVIATYQVGETTGALLVRP